MQYATVAVSRCAHDGVGIDGTAPSLPASVLSWERTRARRTEIAKTLSVSHGSPSRRREPRRSWKACSCNGPTRRHGSPVLPERCCFRIRTRRFTVFVGAYFPICYASLAGWAVLCDRVHGSKDSLAYSSVQPDHGWHVNTDGRLSDLCSARPSWGMMGSRSERGTGRVFTSSGAPFLAPRQQRRVRAIKFSLPRFTRTTVVVRRSAIRTSWCPRGRSSGTGCVLPHAMGVRSINLRQAAIGSARPTSVIRTLALSTAATGKLAVIRGDKPADVRGTMLVTLARCGNRAERQRSGQRCHNLLC
jgi:hypothetical protein